MTTLPALATTRIELPRSTMKLKSRGMFSTRSVTANFPKPSIPASINPSGEYSNLQRHERISAENKAEDLIRGGSTNSCPIESVASVVIVLKEKRRIALVNGDYNLSQSIEEIIGRLNSVVLQKKYSAIKAQEIKSLNIQLSKAEASLKNLVSQWNNKIENFNKTQAIAARKLEQQQFQRIDEFDQDQTSNLPPNFCKLSSNLLELRELERRLVITKRYDEATRIHKEANTIQTKEEEEQKKKFLKQGQVYRHKLLESQQQEIECFKERWMRQSEKLQKEMEKEIASHAKVVENIKSKIKDAENEII